MKLGKQFFQIFEIRNIFAKMDLFRAKIDVFSSFSKTPELIGLKFTHNICVGPRIISGNFFSDVRNIFAKIDFFRAKIDVFSNFSKTPEPIGLKFTHNIRVGPGIV